MSDEQRELDAIRDCIEAVRNLPSKARARVASYLTEWVGDNEQPQAVGFAIFGDRRSKSRERTD